MTILEHVEKVQENLNSMVEQMDNDTDYYDAIYHLEQIKEKSDQESKTGHWIKEESVYGWDGKSYQCSVCGRSIHLDAAVEDLEDYPYCHCGAKMESEASE